MKNKRILKNIQPSLYNDLYSIKNNKYSREIKNTQKTLPKINKVSLSPIIQNNKNKDNSNVYQLTDRPIIHAYNKAYTNMNFFYNKKSRNRKGVLHLNCKTTKKFGLSVKNIVLLDKIKSNFESKYITNYKDLNLNDILKKKKNISNENDINKNSKKVSKDIIISSVINNKSNSNIKNVKNIINYTDRNSYGDNNLIVSPTKNQESQTINNITLNKDDTPNLFGKKKLDNLFLKLLSNNISHTIELSNQSNKKISLENVKNLLNEEINALNNKYLINSQRNKKAKNYKTVLKLNKDNIYSKINEDKNYYIQKELLTRIENYDLYSGEEIPEEKKNEQKEKLKKYAHQEKSKIKVLDYNSKKDANEDVLSMNSEINKNKNIKSRNNENNDLFLYNEEYNYSSLNSKTPLKIFKTEFTKNEDNNISYKKQKQILNSLLFQFSSDLNKNLKEYKKKKNLVYDVEINGKSIVSIGKLYQKMYNINSVKKKGLHKFNLNINNNFKERKFLYESTKNLNINKNLTKYKNLNTENNIDKIINNTNSESEENTAKIKSNNKFSYSSMNLSNITENLFKKPIINYKNNNIKKNDIIKKTNYSFSSRNLNNTLSSGNNKTNEENDMTNKKIDKINVGFCGQKNIKENTSQYINKKSKENKEKQNVKKIIKNISLNKKNNNISIHINNNSKNKSKNNISNKKKDINKKEDSHLNILRLVKEIKIEKDKSNNDNDKENKDSNKDKASSNSSISSSSFLSNNNSNSNSNSKNKQEAQMEEKEVEIKENKNIENLEKENNNNKEENKDNKDKINVENGISNDKNKENNNNIINKFSIENKNNELTRKSKKRKNGIKFGKGNNDEDNFEQYEYQDDDDDNNISNKKAKRNSKVNISNILLFNKRPRNSINYNLNFYTKVLQNGKHDFIVRKEVIDILNGNNSHNNSHDENNNKKGNISIDTEEKKFNKRFHPNILEGIMKLKKKKFKKKKKEKGKNIHDLKQIVIENNKKKINDTNEDKEKIDSEMREEIFDKRLQKFFERIHNLKNFKVKNYEEELNILIREHFYNYDDIEAKDRENRMNSFYQKFELGRKQAQSFQKYKKRDIRFVSPIIFKDGSNSKDKNYKKKSID